MRYYFASVKRERHFVNDENQARGFREAARNDFTRAA